MSEKPIPNAPGLSFEDQGDVVVIRIDWRAHGNPNSRAALIRNLVDFIEGYEPGKKGATGDLGNAPSIPNRGGGTG